MDATDNTDKVLIKYLLNELSKDENEELEDEMVLDEELSERFQVVELDLIDRYVLDEMDAAERARFEIGFLLLEPNREKVEDARAFHESLRLKREKRFAAPPVRPAATPPGWFASLSQLQVSALAAALVILILGVVVGLIVFRAREESVANNNAVQSVSPQPTPEASPEASPNNSTNEKHNPAVGKPELIARANVDRSIDEGFGPVNDGSASSTSRGPGGESEPQLIAIPSGSEFLTLKIRLKPHEYYKEGAECSLDISNGRSQRLYPRDGKKYLKPRAKATTGEFPYEISVKFPTAFLKEGRLYRLRIHETSSVTPFKVTFTK